MIIARDLTRELEDLLFGRGIATRCLGNLDSNGNLAIDVVHGKNAEVSLYDTLRREHSELTGIFGTSIAEMKFRTVLYFLAFQLFARIPAEGGPFVSTTVENYDNPEQIPHRSGAVLRYSVRVLTVESSMDETEAQPYLERASRLATEFNQSSRFLKITLKVAHTRSRVHYPGEPDPTFRAAAVQFVEPEMAA